jgi:hypothetical protein
MTESDAVARFCTASAANDLDGMVSTLTLDAELVSPISGRMVFRRRDGLRVLLTAVYGATIQNLGVSVETLRRERWSIKEDL